MVMNLLRAGFLLGGLIVAAAPASAAPVAAELVGNLPAAPLKAGESRLHPLSAGSGDFIRGSLVTHEGLADLDLVGCADGRHLRHFPKDQGSGRFLLVIETAPSCLRVTAHAGGARYDITIDMHLPPAAQQAPERTYLSPTIQRMAAAIQKGETTETFWADVTRRGTPLVEPGPDAATRIVTFLARGAKRNGRIFGAPGGDHDPMERLGQSDIWFRSYTLPTATRLAYQLALDIPDIAGTERERRVAILATAKADPLSHRSWPADARDAFERKSVLELGAAPAQPWIADRGHPKGALQHVTLTSASLGNTRSITIYRPPGFRADAPDNLLLFVFDADAYLGKVPTPTILDNMIAAGRLPPTVAVFVANPDGAARARELPGNAAFADFMAKDLLPRILRDTGLKHSAARTILAGSSFGGLAAATIALRHPAAFGNVLSLSGSFWWHPPGGDPTRPEYVAGLVATMPRQPVRFFLAAGLFERQRLPETGGILDTNRHLRDVLAAKGYQVSYRDFAGGHDYFQWRGLLSDGLEALFGLDAPR